MSVLRTGFTSFTETGEFSPEFISDVNLLISKVYSKWNLYEDEEEFNSSCWAKIVESLKIFDDSVGTLNTYLNWVIWNEATRIYSKHNKMASDDITECLSAPSVWSSSSDELHDFFHRDKLCFFARRAFKLGVFVDQFELYKNYYLGNLTPAVKSFMWSLILLGDKDYEN